MPTTLYCPDEAETLSRPVCTQQARHLRKEIVEFDHLVYLPITHTHPYGWVLGNSLISQNSGAADILSLGINTNSKPQNNEDSENLNAHKGLSANLYVHVQRHQGASSTQYPSSGCPHIQRGADSASQMWGVLELPEI